MGQVQQPHTETASKPLGTVSHHRMVAPDEQRTSQRSHQIHPRPGGAHLPLVAHPSHPSLLTDPPATDTAHITAGRTLDEPWPDDTGHPHIEAQAIAQAALPGVVVDPSRAVIPPRVTHLHGEQPRPPVGPQWHLAEGVEHPADGHFQIPVGGQGVGRHARVAVRQCARLTTITTPLRWDPRAAGSPRRTAGSAYRSHGRTRRPPERYRRESAAEWNT